MLALPVKFRQNVVGNLSIIDSLVMYAAHLKQKSVLN